MMDDEVPIIKTYSRRKPFAVFVPSTALVPSHPTNFSNVRESRLNDKTLVFDNFDDTFDRLAKDVNRSFSFENLSNSSNDNSDARDDIIVPSPPQKRAKTRAGKAIANQKNTADRKFNYEKGNKNKTEKNEKVGVKRRSPNSESSDEDFHLVLEDDEEDNSVNSNKENKSNNTVLKKKRKMFPKVKLNMNLKECSVPVQRFSTNAKLDNIDLNISEINQAEGISGSHNNSSKFAEEDQKTKSMHQLRVVGNFPTSTPRDHKSRMIVDMQNISPIKLDKENKENDDYSRFSITKRKTEEFIKPKSKAVKSIVQNNNSKKTMPKCNAETNVNETNEKISAIERSMDKNNSIISHSSEVNINKQSLDVTPVMNKQNEKISFVESPLLFDDTCEEKSYTSIKPSTLPVKENEQIKNFNTNLFINTEMANHEIGNSDASKYNCSFSPHEWSNDYDSSYGYFQENKNEEQDKSIDFVKDSDSREISNNNFVDDNKTILPSLPEDNMKQTALGTEIMNNTETEGNSVVASNEVDSLEQNDSLNNITVFNDSIVHHLSKNTNVEKNSSKAEEINKYSNHEKLEEFLETNYSNAVSGSHITTRISLRKGKTKFNSTDLKKQDGEVDKNEKLNSISEIVTVDNNQNIDSNEQIDPENKYIVSANSKNQPDQDSQEELEISKLYERSSENQSFITQKNILDSGNEKNENYEQSHKEYDSCRTIETVGMINQKNKLDERLNGQEAVILISRIDIRDLENQSSIMLERNKKKRYRNSIQKSQNKDPNHTATRSKKILDVQNTENKSPILLEKSSRNSIKTKSKNIENNEMDTIAKESNNIDVKRSEKEITSDSKKNEIGPILIKKDLRILVSKLDDPNIQNESPISSKKRVQKKTRKNSLRKSKSTVVTNNEKEYTDKSSETKNDIKTDDYINNQESNSLNRVNINDSSEKIMNNSEINGEINKSSSDQDLCVLLSKLNDPVKITTRKNLYQKRDRPLAPITENQIEKSLKIIEEEDENNEKSTDFNIQNKNVGENSKESSVLDEHEVINSSADNCKNQPVFLKPGKSWARSLSIINHFHNGQNLEELAVGRGQKWRHSVQTILNMQSEGAVQSNNKMNDEERGLRKESLTISDHLQREYSNRVSSIITSPSRFSHRFSIRIIPSGKKSTLTDDFVNSRISSSIADRTRKTSIARKTSLKNKRHTFIETEDDLIKSAKDIILKRCKQTSYLSFADCFPDSYIEHCRKIGEGVYGEVFLYESNTEKSVIKIIPIEGNELVNCEPQKKFHEILSEIIIAEELHKLRFESDYNTNGFVGVNRILCVIGKYPDKLIDLWNIYDKEKKSENDCPSMFGDQQLYIILELAHGGQDLEAYVFQNASESYSIFLQTALTLAVAEQSLEFEHRDLHWGNILISKTDDAHSVFKLGGNQISIPIKGVKVSVIDFTLSRMSYQGCKIFNDLAADPTLFTAQGEYQFDIYRMMRDNVNNDWQRFSPFTNVLWLDYTLDKMITEARYKKKTTKIHKTAIDVMKQLRKEILNYKSAFDLVSNCEKIKSIAKIDANCT